MLGLGLHREEWLGGYTSHRRRLYRLGHISFFGLAIINLLFYLTVQQLHVNGAWVEIAAWAYVAGALTMPVCCVLMAQRPTWRLLFSIPVTSLLIGGIITVTQIVNL